MTFQDALERFLLQIRADGRSEHTIKQYTRHLRLLDRWWAAEGLADDVGAITHLAKPFGLDGFDDFDWTGEGAAEDEDAVEEEDEEEEEAETKGVG